jgi:hypothetical protein
VKGRQSIQLPVDLVALTLDQHENGVTVLFLGDLDQRFVQAIAVLILETELAVVINRAGQRY